MFNLILLSVVIVIFAILFFIKFLCVRLHKNRTLIIKSKSKAMSKNAKIFLLIVWGILVCLEITKYFVYAGVYQDQRI
jgi:hypothetical protein